jgi:hypothetical protein
MPSLAWTPTPGSSNGAGFAYDPDARALHVRFNSGHQYLYNDVPAEVHDGLMHTDSIGSYIHDNVKGQYDYRRTA